MTAGIPGTGPYARLKNLRRTIQDIKYEINMLNPGPRTLKGLRKHQISVRLEINNLLADIKSGRFGESDAN